MQTATHRSTVLYHAVTLLLGAVMAAAIWLLGYAEISSLGFAAAAIYGETPGSGARERA
jgi:hypothetical protein